MAEIRNAAIEINPIGGHPGQRNVRISYDLITAKDDQLLHQNVTETVLLHAVNCHDAPIEPTTKPVSTVRAVFSATESVMHRVIDQTVLRTALDVEQDWWSTEQDGNVVAIAELIDHLAAEVQIVGNGEVLAEASTPVVSGSWGALGKD